MFGIKFFSMSKRSLGCGDNLFHNIKKQVNCTVVCLYTLLNYELRCFFLQYMLISKRTLQTQPSGKNNTANTFLNVFI